MNPLTQIKNTQKASKAEIAAGVSDTASWHARFKHSAYIFAGGLAYDLTEGDLLAVFAQYGEVVHVDLIRDKDTGKSRGFAFLAYEDQRSTVLAVDNLSGSRVSKRTIRVEHVDSYKLKKAEVEGRAVSDSSEEEEAGPDLTGWQRDQPEAAAGAERVPAETNSAADAWAGPGSVFALLHGGGPLAQAAITLANAPGQDKRGKKEKAGHKTKDKHRHRDKLKAKTSKHDRQKHGHKDERR